MTQLMAFFQAHPTLWEALKLVALVGLTAALLAVLLRLERRMARRLFAKNDNINLRFVESVSRFIIIFVAVLWLVMSSKITEPLGRVVFQGTAIVGAIAGFAAQPVIADLICGLMISSAKPFNIGDRIELEDGSAGIVKDITLRHVVIQTIDTVRLIIPNSRLNGMLVTNMSYHTAVRSVHFRFNVSYDTDPTQAMAVIRQAVESCPYTIPGHPGEHGDEYGPVYFIAYADSSLVMATTAYYQPTVPSEAVKSDINTRVKQALDENGIEIPYNYVNVVMSGEKG